MKSWILKSPMRSWILKSLIKSWILKSLMQILDVRKSHDIFAGKTAETIIG